MKPQCFMPRCERARDGRQAICGECYRALPNDLKQALTRAFHPTDMTLETMTGGFRYALNEASAWMLATFGEVQREKYDPGKWERLCRYVRDRDEARRVRNEAAKPEPDPVPVPHLRLVP
jgi:hypothetical protein